MQKIFKHIYFELTDICDRNCSFCPEVKREKMFMPKNDAFSFLEQISTMTEAVYWHLQGEPLLHPDFMEISAFAAELGLTQKLTTNASKLEKYTEFLTGGNFHQINFSIQSLNEVNKNERRRVLNNIADFTIAALDRRPEMYINFRYWQNSPPDIAFFAEKFNIPAEKWLPPEGRHSVNICGRLYCTFDREFVWPTDSPSRSGGDKGSCRGLIDHIGILCDGRVVPCCLDCNGDLALGNLRKDTIENILNSPQAIAIAENFKKGRRIRQICQNCDFASRFDSKKGN